MLRVVVIVRILRLVRVVRLVGVARILGPVITEIIAMVLRIFNTAKMTILLVAVAVRLEQPK